MLSRLFVKTRNVFRRSLRCVRASRSRRVQKLNKSGQTCIVRLFDRIPRTGLIGDETKPFRTHIPVSRILIGTL